jgi:hypothetical protein
MLNSFIGFGMNSIFNIIDTNKKNRGYYNIQDLTIFKEIEKRKSYIQLVEDMEYQRNFLLNKQGSAILLWIQDLFKTKSNITEQLLWFYNTNQYDICSENYQKQDMCINQLDHTFFYWSKNDLSLMENVIIEEENNTGYTSFFKDTVFSKEFPAGKSNADNAVEIVNYIVNLLINMYKELDKYNPQLTLIDKLCLQ